MSAESIIIRVLVILLLVVRTLYWRFLERKAEEEKAKTKKRTAFIGFHIIARNILNLLVFIQLIGLNIFPFRQTLLVASLGLIICIAAVSVSLFGRRQLGTNWADGAEYQIKKQHHLVASGIYGVIRHPIILGYALFIIGAELAVCSMLVIPLGILLLAASYTQSQKEERILTEHFGQAYKSYKKKTKMLIPFIF